MKARSETSAVKIKFNLALLSLLYKQCFTGISPTEKSHIFSHVKISANQKSFSVAMFSCLEMDNSSVYITNRIIHGRLEIWYLSSRVHI